MNIEQAFTTGSSDRGDSLKEAGQGLAGLELRAREVVDGFLAGGHRGPRRGSSAEFAEHREYAPGDDLRYLDWKVYGKHDRYYLKQLEQETNFTCHLLLDASASMGYRSDAALATKLEHASLATAALAWLALRQHDLVSLTFLSHSAATVVRPSGLASHFQELASRLEKLSTTPYRDVETPGIADRSEPLGSVHEWAETWQHRSVVIVVSDFFGPPESTTLALRHLRSRRHDVIALHVIDPAEQDFPFEEPTLFHDVESSRTQAVDCRRVAAAYRVEFEAYRRRLEAECRDMGVDYLLLRTDMRVERSLAAFLAARTRGGTTTR